VKKGLLFSKLQHFSSLQSVLFVSRKRAIRLFKACTMFCGSPESVRHSPLSTEMDVTTPGLPKACGAVSPKHARAKRLNIQSVMRSFHFYDFLFLAASCSNRQPISSYRCCNLRSRSSSVTSPSTTTRLSRWANPLPALSTLSG